MSTSKGNNTRKRPQKHQNKSVFKNDLHDTSHKTKFLNSLEVTGVCKRCRDIIEWKIKYKKYKPLSAPRKCVNCEQKTVKYAYHMLCNKCAKEKNVCAKCCQAVEKQDSSQLVEDSDSMDVKTMLKGLPERKRRTIIRFLNKNQEGEEKMSPELKLQIEDMLAKMEDMNFDDDISGFSNEDAIESDGDLD